MSHGNKSGWRLGKKDEEHSGIKNHYYVFVNLTEIRMMPEYYIIPYNEVANFIRSEHKAWLSGKKRDGSDRKDTDIRVLDVYASVRAANFAEKYKNNWDILELF